LVDHIKWLSHNEEKKPKFDAHGKRQVVSHFYSSGSVCPKTGEKRETEVIITNYHLLIILNFNIIIHNNS